MDDTPWGNLSQELPAPADEPFVRVLVVDAAGSTPADAGARMLVTAAGLHSGTVGGGRVEARALADAQAMLSDPQSPRTRFVDWNLKRDIGMTCGGTMRLFFERCNAAEWEIAVFGAGHVAQALIRLCLTLPCRVRCVDARREWLDRLPRDGRLRVACEEDLAAEAGRLDAGTFVLCMTRGHATDRPILAAALRRRPAHPFVGVIGSASKAAVLRRELAEEGVAAEDIARMVCPLGLPIGDNHAGEIAVSIAAQLLQERDRLRAAAAVRPA